MHAGCLRCYQRPPATHNNMSAHAKRHHEPSTVFDCSIKHPSPMPAACRWWHWTRRKQGCRAPAQRCRLPSQAALPGSCFASAPRSHCMQLKAISAAGAHSMHAATQCRVPQTRTSCRLGCEVPLCKPVAGYVQRAGGGMKAGRSLTLTSSGAGGRGPQRPGSAFLFGTARHGGLCRLQLRRRVSVPDALPLFKTGAVMRTNGTVAHLGGSAGA